MMMMTTAVSEVRASHLLVETEEQAAQLRTEITEGKAFAEVASAVSKCPSSRNGGDLGFFGRGRMVPEFDQAAFTLPVGEVSQPIKTQFGWHLLVVTETR
jgi:peptidyl-prolyl cis-trans isomerase C